jgi:hypothetical protein
MHKITVEESKLIGGEPSKVYRIIADPKHHAKILPAQYLDYKAESDDIVSFGLVFAGKRQDMRARIEQTEPNRVFKEYGLDAPIVTEFVLDEQPDGTLVTIRTVYECKRGIQGWIERLFVPGMLRRLFDEELTKLARYVLVVE